jgi:cobyrinic acid a,c-diamide synthase
VPPLPRPPGDPGRAPGVLGPRLVVAGTRSGVGKTTVATGMMAALRRRGRRVAPAKVGPDFIDPGYHALATGRPGRNLDIWMSGVDAIAPLAGRAAAGADILVVEGVMGLFDGAADGSPSSTAEVAKRIDAPVVLVVDASSMSQSVAAMVHGYRTWDPALRVGGVILNMVASDSHERMLRGALAGTGLPVLGALRRDDAVSWRSRHLGLLPVVENPAAVGASLERLAAVIEARCDLDGLERLAATAPVVTVPPVPAPAVAGRARVAVAAGPAFSFCYPDNLEALTAAGAEVLPFDPCEDEAIPEGVGAVVAGGGFPEVYAEALSANRPMLASLRAHQARGGVVWAECGGLLWLARSLDGWPMAGLVDATAALTGTRVLGYRSARTALSSPLGPAGTELRGHEFHYSATDPGGDALVLTGRHGTSTGGFAGPRLLASYLHVHLAAAPHLAEAVVRAASPA